MRKEEIKAFNSNEQDFGKQALNTPLTLDEKKLSALMLAVNASVAQFLLEGVMQQGDQLHFMIHLQDFMAKFFAGEVVKLEGVPQTLDINSAIGKIFLDAANDGLVNGKENVEHLKEAIKAATEEMQAENKQTSLPGEQDNMPKPKWLN